MKRRVIGLALVCAAVILPACGGGSGDSVELLIYSGRAQPLVGDLLDRFEEESGLTVKVRYGETPALANQILEEGDATPADVFFSQDAGSLGALVADDRLIKLPQKFLDKVESRYRSNQGFWVGTSGRSRTMVFNPERIKESELPASVLDLAGPEWRGRVGWAPQNASFQSFITALRLLKGEDVAKGWIEGMVINDTTPFPNNVTIVQAVADGEIDVGLVNHYYLPELLKQDPDLAAVNHFVPGGDPGGLINVAGVGILDGTEHRDAAEQFVEFLLSVEAQEYFANVTYEYPLADGVPPDKTLPTLESLDPPDIDLSDLKDLQGTQAMLTDAGAL
jgi:iron(III) transport system substrate-binding protein